MSVDLLRAFDGQEVPILVITAKTKLLKLVERSSPIALAISIEELSKDEDSYSQGALWNVTAFVFGPDRQGSAYHL